MAGLGGAPVRFGTAVAGAVLVAAGMLAPAVPALAAKAARAPADWKPKPPRVRVLPRTEAPRPARVRLPVVPEGRQADSAWPAAGAGTADYGGSARLAGLVQAGRLPVAAAIPGNGMSAVSASILGRQAALRLGITGVVFTVRADGLASGAVRVGLDYASFANAVGGDLADRLRLVELPACALTTPQAAACRREAPVSARLGHRSRFDGVGDGGPGRGAEGRPGARAAPGRRSRDRGRDPGAGGGRPRRRAATATSPQTSLSPSGTWAAGGSPGR